MHTPMPYASVLGDDYVSCANCYPTQAALFEATLNHIYRSVDTGNCGCVPESHFLSVLEAVSPGSCGRIAAYLHSANSARGT
jgi:hypothetical protein